MKIYPDYYKQFRCIGKDCISTCCAGWDIDFDSETVDFYRSRTDAFGEFLNKNIEEKDGTAMVIMPETKRCPFLDEDGLCRVYQNYGEEHMSMTCKNFPRRRRLFNNHAICSMSLSCEGLLQLLYDWPQMVTIVTEGSISMETMGDLRIKELFWFLSSGCRLLQDTSVPLGVALGAVIYTGIEAGKYYEKHDFEQFESVVYRMPEITQQFLQSGEELAAGEMMESGQQLIFNIVDTFCQIVREWDVFGAEKFLWPSYVFGYTDRERKQYIRTCLANQNRDLGHRNFWRKLAVACFFGHASALGAEDCESIFLQDMCIYLILAKVMPLTWGCSEARDTRQYFCRLSMIARQFEQNKIVQKFIWPVIQELFEPDVFSFTIAFMTLFD